MDEKNEFHNGNCIANVLTLDEGVDPLPSPKEPDDWRNWLANLVLVFHWIRARQLISNELTKG